MKLGGKIVDMTDSSEIMDELFENHEVSPEELEKMKEILKLALENIDFINKKED